MSFGDSKIGGFSGASRSDMGVSHFDKMGSSIGSRSSSSSSDNFQQALKKEGAENSLSSLLPDRNSAVAKSKDGMNDSSPTPSSANATTDADNSISQEAEGSTDIADSLMSVIAKLMDLMTDGADKGSESAAAEPNSGSTEAKGAEGSSATEGAMGADSTNGDEGATNPQDPVQLLQMMLELITQLISMLQDKTSDATAGKAEGGEGEAAPVAAVDEGDIPSVGEEADSADGEVSGKEGKGATGADEASSSSDVMGASGAEDAGKIAATEGVSMAGATGIEGEMGSQDTISLLQELLKLLTQMIDMMQDKPADTTSGAESEEGSSGVTESAAPSSKAETTGAGSVPAEEGVGDVESDSGDAPAEGMEQLLEPLLGLLTELVAMMQGKPADGEAPVGATSGKENGMDAGKASSTEEPTSIGEMSSVGAEEGSVDSPVSAQSLGDILKLLTQVIEMLQGQSAEADSGEVAAAEEGAMGASGAGDAMEVEAAGAEEGAAPESLDKDQLLEKVFMLLTQLLTQMMQQMGGGKD